LDVYGGKGRVGHRLYIGGKEIREEMEYLEIKDMIESDHPPVIAWMRRERERRKNGEEGQRGMG